MRAAQEFTAKGMGQAVRLRDGGARVLTTARMMPNGLADANLFVATDLSTAEGGACEDYR